MDLAERESRYKEREGSRRAEEEPAQTHAVLTEICVTNYPISTFIVSARASSQLLLFLLALFNVFCTYSLVKFLYIYQGFFSFIPQNKF